MKKLNIFAVVLICVTAISTSIYSYQKTRVTDPRIIANIKAISGPAKSFTCYDEDTGWVDAYWGFICTDCLPGKHTGGGKSICYK